VVEDHDRDHALLAHRGLNPGDAIEADFHLEPG